MKRLHQIAEAIRALRTLDTTMDPAVAARWGPWPLPSICRCGHHRRQHPRQWNRLVSESGRTATWRVRACLQRHVDCGCARYVPAWAAILGLRDLHRDPPTWDEKAGWNWRDT